MSSELVSYAAAVVASFGNALSNVMQRKASLEQSDGVEFGLTFLARLVRDRTWLLGFAGMAASFFFQALALERGQLSAVETIITLEVPLTLLAASHVFASRLTRREWVAIALMTAGMVGLIGSLDPRPGNESAVDGPTYALAGGATLLTIVVLLAFANGRPPLATTALRGAAAGASFGLSATLIKETVAQYDAHGISAVMSTWQTYGAIIVGVGGVLVMQWALHSGPLLAAQPGFTLMDPLVSILWGVLVYDEVTRTGGWLILACAGGVALGSGVVVLARSPVFSADDAVGDPQPAQLAPEY
jgi:drug/metabolite transporter (DMT)-like permease